MCQLPCMLLSYSMELHSSLINMLMHASGRMNFNLIFWNIVSYARFNQLIKTLLKNIENKTNTEGVWDVEATDPQVWIRMIASFVKATLNPHVPRMFSLDRISTTTIASFSCTLHSLCSFDVTSIPFEINCILIPYSSAMHVWLATIHQLWRSSPSIYF